MGQSSYIRCSEKSPWGGDIGAERSGPGRGPVGAQPLSQLEGQREGGQGGCGRWQAAGKGGSDFAPIRMGRSEQGSDSVTSSTVEASMGT